MATIAEQLTSLANTKTAIKDAIVAKGVAVADTDPFSAYASKIGEISGGGAATKFGASVDTWIGDVDENGELQAPTGDTHLDFAGVKRLYGGALEYAFYGRTGIKTVNFSSLQSSGSSGLYYTFYGCAGITSVDFSSLTFVGTSGMAYTFQNCTGITNVDLSSLETIDTNGIQYIFNGCTGITNVDFSSLQSVGLNGMQSAFQQCAFTTMSFPSLTSVQTNSFGTTSYNSAFRNCTALTEIHFRADMQATIEAMSQYENKWGATNASIIFDL